MVDVVARDIGRLPLRRLRLAVFQLPVMDDISRNFAVDNIGSSPFDIDLLVRHGQHDNLIGGCSRPSDLDPQY